MRRTWGLAAIVMVALYAACTPGSPDEAPQPETESMELSVVHDFAVFPTVPDTELAGVDAETIEVGEGRAAILAIERPTLSPACITAAQLRLYLQTASDLVDEQLAVYPSHVFNGAQKRDGDKFGYSGTALDIRPRASMQSDGSGWSRSDVTDIVKRWLGREPFPSQGLRPPKRGPIVLTLRDVEGAEPFATATFASSDAPHNTPHVIVTHDQGCA